jgi:hypothetical protein
MTDDDTASAPGRLRSPRAIRAELAARLRAGGPQALAALATRPELRVIAIELLAAMRTEAALDVLLACFGDTLDAAAGPLADRASEADTERALVAAFDTMLGADEPAATTPSQARRIDAFLRRLESQAPGADDRALARSARRGLHPWPHPRAAMRLRASIGALATEIAQAPPAADLAPLFERLDDAAERVGVDFDDDLAARLLHEAALRVADPARGTAMLGHALVRQRWCASGATSGGEGLARLVLAREIEAALDARMPAPRAITPFGVPARLPPLGALRYPRFLLRHLGTRVVRSPIAVPIALRDVDIASPASRQSVSWSAGTGLVLPTGFVVDDRRYRLDIGSAADGRRLADDEIVVAEDCIAPHDDDQVDEDASQSRSQVWLDPWDPIERLPAETREALARQLARELAPGHPLHGLPLRLVACGEGDDALFAIDDGSGRVATVHLTRGDRQPAPWPSARLHASLDVWRDEVMRPDHDARREAGA